jgi:uncharacterized membrane protein
LWHQGRARNPLHWALAGVVLLAGVIVWLQPGATKNIATQSINTPANASFDSNNQLTQVQAVINQRCVMCHNAQVQMKNVRLDSVQAIQAQAQSIYQQAVVQKLMPMNNATGITEAERALLKTWFENIK